MYLFGSKYEVYSWFYEFKDFMENYSGRKTKLLRTNNGVKFCLTHFYRFYKKCEIKRHKTTPYTSDQNGIVERMNKILMERSRIRFSGANLEYKF